MSSPHPRLSAGDVTTRRVVIVGGAAIAVAPFLPWVHVVLLGDLNLFDLTSAAGSSRAWALVPLRLGIAIVISAWRRGPWARILAVAGGVIAGLMDGILLAVLLDQVRQAYGLAQVQFGPWLGLLGGLAALVGGLRLAVRNI